MANSADGRSWLTNTPVVTDLRSAGHQEILGLRQGMALRLNKEHGTMAVMTGGDTTLGGGEHVAGSAFAYFSDSETNNRPSGDALTTADSGRLWVDTTGSAYVMKVYDHDASTSFQNISGVQKTTGSFTTTDLNAAPQTANCLFVPDLFILTFEAFSYTILPALLMPDSIMESTGVSNRSITFSIIGNTITMTKLDFTQPSSGVQPTSFWLALKF